MPFDHGNVRLGQVLIVLLLGLVVIAVRLSGWRGRKIAALRAEIERRSEMVRSYKEGTKAYVLYIEETDAMSDKIRKLQQGGGGLAKLPAILAAAIGLGIAWYGTSTSSPTVTMTGAAMVLISILLFITS